jgi:phasin family protein
LIDGVEPLPVMKDVPMKSFPSASFPFPTSFSFARPDLGKAWFALPSLNIEALGEANRKNAAAVSRANQAVFDGLNTLAQRHADLFKTTLDDCSKLGSDVLASASLDDRVMKQADAARQICHSTVAHLRELSDIAVKANVAATDILNARVAEAFDEFRALFAAPVAPSAVAPASLITDPGADVEEVDTVRQEVVEVDDEPSVIAAPTTKPKTAGPAARAGRRPRARS